MKETVIRNDPAKDEEERRKGFAVANVKRYDTIRLEYCDRVTIDGIVIRDSLIYNIRPIMSRPRAASMAACCFRPASTGIPNIRPAVRAAASPFRN